MKPQQKLFFIYEEPGTRELEKLNVFLENGWRIVSVTTAHHNHANIIACAYVLLEKP